MRGMRQSLAIAFSSGLVGGCSLIFNVNNLGKPADGPLPPDASIVRDADPSMLMVLDVQPNVIMTGQGSNGASPATLVIDGHNFTDGFTVDIEPSTGINKVGSAMRSFDGDHIAIQLEADVIDGPGGSAVPLTITVSEPKAPSQSTMATLEVLPTLKSSALDYDTLAKTTYAQIAIGSGALTFTGTPAAVQLRSVSSVSIGAAINAVGGGASGKTPGGAGPGGCAGGADSAAGGCDVGGGGGASNSDGGGGGGFANPGKPGGGEPNGGMAHGNTAVLNYAADNAGHTPNQSAGGGGGNGGSLTSGTGGAGGGGGGTVEIDAGGNIAVASIDVSGGIGGNGGGLTSATGGGGGGTGGVIVIRSAAGDLTVNGTLAAAGGMGGTGGGSLSNTGGVGGNGSIGRVRTDVPTLPSVAGVVVYPGLRFDATTNAIATMSKYSVIFHGNPGDTFVLADYDFTGASQETEPAGTFDTSGNATPVLSLHAGYNNICATLLDGVPKTSLADTCMVIVYLP